MKTLIFIFGYVVLLHQSGKAQYWEQVGNFVPNNAVTSIYGDSELNKLIICGDFRYYDSLLVYGICTWDGDTIEGVGDSLYCIGSCSHKKDIIRYEDHIYIGFYGDEDFVNHNFNSICRWDGESWSNVNGNDITDSNGNDAAAVGFNIIDDKLYVLGGFSYADYQPATGIAIWDGEEWTSLQIPGVDFAILSSAVKFGDNYYFAGNINYLGNDGEEHDDIVVYDGENWHPMNFYGFSSGISDMVIYKGELYIVGGFTQQEGNAGDKIMKLQNGEWVKVGQSGGGGGAINDMVVFHDELYVAGVFDYVDGDLPAFNIAKWNGEKWCSIGNDYFITINDMTVWNDELYVAGGYVENPGLPPIIYTLCKWTGGDYVSQCGEPVTASSALPVEKNNLRLYPNPLSTNLLTAEYPDWPDESVSVSVVNSMGIMVQRQEAQMSGGKVVITLPESLPPGYYTVSLWCERRGERVVQRFMRM